MNWVLKDDPGGFKIRWSESVASRYRAEGFWREEVLTDVARAATKAAPDAPLLIERDRRLTRGDAFEQALRLVNFFYSCGLKRGDVVSFQLPNWIETAVIALAARMAGLILNPIPPIYRAAELRYILEDCHSKLIFTPTVFRGHDYARMMADLSSEYEAAPRIVTVRGETGGAWSWADAMSQPPIPEPDLPVIDPATVAVIMYTSGTSGRPKGVLHTHYGFDYRARTMAEAWGVETGDMIFTPTSVTHAGGAYWAHLIPWFRSATTVLLDVWSPDEAVRCIEDNRCTIAGGAAPILQQLVRAGSQHPAALASLRVYHCGGAAVSADLIREASRVLPNCLIFRVYGLTEMPSIGLGISSRSQVAMGAETDGQVGYPTEVRIVDPTTGTPVRDGAEGEILARGPEQCAGYLHVEDNQDSFDDEGYFHTGDLGSLVDGRYIRISGRKKDIIIRSGENVSPKEIEDLLLTHRAVEDVAVVAMPSAATGEMGCAFVVLKPGHQIDLDEIRRFLAQAGLARQKIPEHLVLTEDLPRVPTGKVRKDVLRQRARELAQMERT